jgi:acyl carrier protein
LVEDVSTGQAADSRSRTNFVKEVPLSASSAVEAKIWAVLARRFTKHRELFELETRLREDLGADSLDLLELMFELEEELGVSLTEKSIGKLRTIGDTVGYIRDLGPPALVRSPRSSS